MKSRMVLRVGILIAALSTAGAASFAAVTLPDKANSHAVDSTANITTGSTNADNANVNADSSAEPSPAEAAAYGQCVAANAKTASENAGQDWNPTDGCTNANAGAANAQNDSAATGASAHANSHASTGLSTAANAGSNGSDNAEAGAGNAP